MADAIARIRIARVRLKSNGATITLLTKPELNTTASEMVGWMRAVIDCERLPDAVLCVAFVYDEGSWYGSACWHSESPYLPTKMLPAMAREYAASFMTEERAERTIMRKLGYRPLEPRPDGA